MWNKEGKSILVFLTGRCKELEEDKELLAQQLVSKPPTVLELPEFVRSVSRVRECLPRLVALRDRISLARLNIANLNDVLRDALAEIEAARAGYLETISVNGLASAQYLGTAAWVLSKLHEELAEFLEGIPAGT